jgi:hypothetical protein
MNRTHACFGNCAEQYIGMFNQLPAVHSFLVLYKLPYNVVIYGRVLELTGVDA